PLPEDRERAVLSPTRARCKALGDLALEHQHRPIERRVRGEKTLEDRLRGAVRKVPDHEDAALRSRAERREPLVRIDAPVGQPGRRAARPTSPPPAPGPPAGPRGGPIPERGIDLEREEPARPRREGPRERAGAGADLAHDVGRGGADGLHDPRRHARIAQKVLAEDPPLSPGGGVRTPAWSRAVSGHEARPVAVRRAACSATSAAWTARTWDAVSSGGPELSKTTWACRTFSTSGIWLATRRAASARS